MTQNKVQDALDMWKTVDPEHGCAITDKQMTEYERRCSVVVITNYETILAALEMYRIVHSGELEKEEQKIFGEKIEEPEPWMDDYSVFESAELLGFQRGNNAVLHKLKEIK